MNPLNYDSITQFCNHSFEIILELYFYIKIMLALTRKEILFCACMCAGAYTRVCMQRPEVNIECLSQKLFTWTFGYSSSADLELTNSTRLAWEQVAGSTCVCFPEPLVWGFRYMPPCPILHKDIGNLDSGSGSHIKHFINWAISPAHLCFVFSAKVLEPCSPHWPHTPLRLPIFLPLSPKVLGWQANVTMQCWRLKPVPGAH